jgi:hypothetical protein
LIIGANKKQKKLRKYKTQKMEMFPVISSNLAAVGYDFDSAVLRVEFLKGGMYEYHGVPSEVYEGLINASSKGQYFSQFIKKSYPFSRM